MAVGDARETDGPDAVALASSVGLDAFPWQRSVLDDWCARDAHDRPAYATVGLSMPRQNGKNAALEVFELYELAVSGWHVLHTAHRVKTSKKSFQRLVRYFTDKAHPELNALVRNVRYTNGEEGIYLTNGASVEFSARSRAASRGFDDIQLVVFDEAQDLTDDQLNAIMYTLAASSTGDRMMLYTGTPPDPASPGTVFPRIREAALARPGKRTLWHEWGVTELPPRGAAFNDLIDDIYAANPSMGYVLDEGFTETEFSNSDIDGFARERLGWWSEQGSAAAILRADWEACGISREGAPTEGRKAFGVKFSPDGSLVALSACRMPDEGPAFVECVGTGSMADGIGWLERFLCTEDMADTTAAVAVDGRNGAGALLDKLRDVYPRQALAVPGSRGVVDASSMFEQALRERSVTHWDSPNGEQEALDRSALGAVKRPVGSDGGWAYGGDESAVIESAVLAYWAARTTKRDPDGGCVIL